MAESIQSVPAFTPRPEAYGLRRRAARPTAREWVRHTALFLLTSLTATLAGTGLAVPFNAIPEPALAASTPLDYVLYVPAYYVRSLWLLGAYVSAHTVYLAWGATFAAALLFILLAHEAGHYVACRLYGVDATLPFFIPVPPPFLAGTLGAFIKIRSPIPSRRALFDIGVAGPLAGFVALVPVAVAAVLTATPEFLAPAPGATLISFNPPPLLQLLGSALGVPDLVNVALNPFYLAAWVGLLVTSLNLLPVGQLDGGHAVYALFGARDHRRAGRAAFISVLALAPLGWLWHGAPSGLVYAILLFIMLRIRHPEAEDEGDALGRVRVAVALLTLVVFLLSFTPFPLTLS